MLQYAACFKYYNTQTGRFDGPLQLFPGRPTHLKSLHLPIQMLTTTVMAESVLNEMLEPTERLAGLWQVAEEGSNPIISLATFYVCGYDLLNAIVVQRDTKRRFRSYTLFGYSIPSQGLQQFRVRPTKRDLPDRLFELAPPNYRLECVPNQYSVKAGIVLDRCLRCTTSAPLGAAGLCGRCILLQE